jgi:prolipoprotein diacylglyceryltransferase
MSSIFWYGLIYCLFFLFAIACFLSLSLDANNFGNLQELDFQDFEQQPAGEQGK